MSESGQTTRQTVGHGPTRQLMLFVAGDQPNSLTARENLQKICNVTPDRTFQVRIVDVLEDYKTALEHRVLVTPCLVLLEPPPRVMIVGTLKDRGKVSAALRIGAEVPAHE